MLLWPGIRFEIALATVFISAERVGSGFISGPGPPRAGSTGSSVILLISLSRASASLEPKFPQVAIALQARMPIGSITAPPIGVKGKVSDPPPFGELITICWLGVTLVTVAANIFRPITS